MQCFDGCRPTQRRDRPAANPPRKRCQERTVCRQHLPFEGLAGRARAPAELTDGGTVLPASRRSVVPRGSMQSLLGKHAGQEPGQTPLPSIRKDDSVRATHDLNPVLPRLQSLAPCACPLPPIFGTRVDAGSHPSNRLQTRDGTKTSQPSPGRQLPTPEVVGRNQGDPDSRSDLPSQPGSPLEFVGQLGVGAFVPEGRSRHGPHGIACVLEVDEIQDVQPHLPALLVTLERVAPDSIESIAPFRARGACRREQQGQPQRPSRSLSHVRMMLTLWAGARHAR